MAGVQAGKFESTCGRDAGIAFLTFPDLWQDGGLLREWEYFLSCSDNLNVMYQSPPWLAFLQETGQISLASIAVARAESGNLVGVVPLCEHIGKMPFDVAGRSLYDLPLRQVDLLGGELMLPPETEVYDRFFLALDEAFPDCECFILDSLSCSGFTWHYLQQSKVVRGRYLPYILDGKRDYHILRLPPTLRSYLAEFNRKKRYNLKRQVRILKNNCEKELELVRVESRKDIEIWIEARRAIDQSQRHVLPHRTDIKGEAKATRRMGDLADRGLLRNYVLRSGERYFGCISGCQYRDLYNVWYIIHNNDFAKYSPGTCTFFLAIEDLLAHRPAAMVNLGFGDPRQNFSTQMVAQHATAVLFRKTARNRLYRTSHSAFRAGVKWLKRMKGTPC
jgi:hypothetical protein